MPATVFVAVKINVECETTLYITVRMTVKDMFLLESNVKIVQNVTNC